ncbi:MAG: methylated-DNA--[protein]-cysteine S-methyltransferase [Actinomycetota bacterium]|nr:methylated-DNA--[protein]-cysteine S-methyltransferase [Actinomycetota bacterium]
MASLPYASPAGTLTLIGYGTHLSRILFADQRPPPVSGDPAHLNPVAAQLDEYFSGERTAFDLQLKLRGTPFQQRVWAALAGIPFGETTTYGTIASSLTTDDADPVEPRAVGSAVGATPIPIVVPCHRVIGADGSLTGYRGGLELKRNLLAFEGSGGNPASLSPDWGRQLSLA